MVIQCNTKYLSNYLKALFHLLFPSSSLALLTRLQCYRQNFCLSQAVVHRFASHSLWIDQSEVLYRLKSMSVAHHQKQPSRGVLRKRCSENMKQIYRRTPMPKCDFNKIVLLWVFSCKFTTYFRTPFYKNTYGGLLLYHLSSKLKKLL